MLLNLLPVATCRRCPRRLSHGQTACEPATMKFHAIGGSPNTMLKQEGFQLAEASFRDKKLDTPGDVPSRSFAQKHLEYSIYSIRS